MPTAILQSPVKSRSGNVKVTETTKVITHNSSRLYHEAGRTYEFVGTDRNGNRIYRDTQKR
jgi:hypothetical protein